MTAAPSTPPRPPRLRNGLLLVAAALLAALLVRAVAIEGFRIPSESMEGSLLVGDFVLVSKLHYGPRLPMSLGIPLTDVYARGVELPYLRLPGFTEVRRGDAVVFNYPPDTGPVDRRMHYIKRVVGLPGDTVAIRGKEVYVNGRRLDLGQGVQQRWVAHTTAPAAVSFDTLAALGAASVQMRGRRRDQLTFEGTRAAARRVEALAAVERVEPYLRDDPHFAVRIFPAGSGFGRDDYGPLYVPRRGDTLAVGRHNWTAYQALIVRHEDHPEARLLPDGTPEISGRRTTDYVVGQDYYFVLGDNRDSSVDSRVWGFVPRDHLVGKAVYVYFSWDERRGRPRYDRMLRGVQ